MLAACGAVLIGGRRDAFSPFYAAVSLTTLRTETAPVRFRPRPDTLSPRYCSFQGGCTLWGERREGARTRQAPANKAEWPLSGGWQ